MKLKRLKEERAELLEEIEKLNDNTTSTREHKKIDDLFDKIDFLDYQIEKEERALNSKIYKPVNKDEVEVKGADALLRPSEMETRDFVDAFTETNRFSSNKRTTMKEFAEYLLFKKGEQRATTVDGSVLVPKEILAEVLHLATKKSVLLNDCPFVRMTAPTTIIGRVNTNPKLDFKKKGEIGLQTGIVLDGVELEAKTLYGWIEIAEEDIADIHNFENVIREAFANALSETLDGAFLYRHPNYTDETNNPNYGVYPKNSVCDLADINNVDTKATIDFDSILKGMLPIAKANKQATSVAMSPVNEFALHMLKDGDGTYKLAPAIMNTLTKVSSTGMKDTDILVYDRNAIVIGVKDGVSVKVNNNLTRGTVILRIMLRADVCVTDPKAVTLVKVTETA